MKVFILFLVLYYVPQKIIGQESLVDVYKNHKFPCDSESTNVKINICSGVKTGFVDSLLNNLYNKILRSIDKEISTHNNAAKQKQTNKNDSAEVRFAMEQRDYYMRIKQSIVNSQTEWIKLRDLNSRVEQLLCNGGAACTTLVNEAYVEDTLDRIKKLESFGLID